MPKRKPPSRRPEKQMDETARAIARLREEADAEKAAETGKLVTDDLKSQAEHTRNLTGPMKTGRGAPAPVVRRQKTGGS
jgi:hypothetical protein